MIKVVVCGAMGRMGGTVARLIHEAHDMEFAGGVDLKEGNIHGAPSLPRPGSTHSSPP